MAGEKLNEDVVFAKKLLEYAKQGKSGIDKKRLVNVFDKWKNGDRSEPFANLALDEGVVGIELWGNILDGKAFSENYRDSVTMVIDQKKSQNLESIVSTEADLANFEIKRQFAEGGLGYIVLAKDKNLERDVALKFAISTDRKAQKEFKKEGQIQAQTEHINVAKLYQFGIVDKEFLIPSDKTNIGRDIVIPESAAYCVMELLKGETLLDFLHDKKGKLSQKQILPIIKDVLKGTQALHEKGVIHRDLKPENIWIGRKDNRGQVIDFGLAKLIKEKDSMDEESITISLDADVGQSIKGTIKGTLQYMSPEQADAKKLDERSDIYALGTILYEMFSGRVMVKAAATPHLTLDNVITTMPKRPPGCTNDMWAILQKMLEKSKSQRYRQISEVLEDIKKLETGFPVSAQDYSKPGLFSKWYLRNMLLTIPGTLLLVGLPILVGSQYMAVSARADAAEASVNQEKAEKLAAKKSEQASKANEKAAIAEADKQKKVAEANAKVAKANADAAASEKEKRESLEKRLEAIDLMEKGISHANAGNSEDAKKSYLAAVKEDKTFSLAYANVAWALYEESLSTTNKDNKQEILEEAILYADKSMKVDPTKDKTLEKSNLAVICAELGKLIESEEYLNKAEKMFKEIVESNVKRPDKYLDLGKFYVYKKRKPKLAEKYLKEYIKRAQKDSAGYNHLSAALYLLDKKKEATENVRKALYLKFKSVKKHIGGLVLFPELNNTINKFLEESEKK